MVHLSLFIIYFTISFTLSRYLNLGRRAQGTKLKIYGTVFEKGFNGLNEVLALSRGLESAASLSRQMADIRGDLSSGINVTSSLKPQRRSHNSQYRPTTKPMGSGSSSYANKPLRKCKFCDLVHEFRRGKSGIIEEKMRQIFEIEASKVARVLNRYATSSFEHLSDKESTALDIGLYQGQTLMLELQNENGTWPINIKKSTKSFTSLSHYNTSDYDCNGTSVQPGLCGLNNLGNTCFMNAALQCMSNTSSVTEYFLRDNYYEEINADNPLGMRGEIAKAFGELVKNLWSGRYSHVSPKNFKMQVGRFAPQFSGYSQHDTQELMAFLLDGLHEDLNRIKEKPYIAMKDSDNRPDDDVAKEAWNNYRQRNDSIIVDIFHGLLKSTLVCPECDKISVTFDPFCYLSLPLPVKKERQLEIYFISLDPMNKPLTVFKLTVPKAGSMTDLCKALSNYVDVPPEKLIVADIYNHQVHRIYYSHEAISHIKDRDKTFIYEVPVSSVDHPEITCVPVHLRENLPKTGYGYTPSYKMFGQPFFVPVPRKNCTYDKLYSLILKQMSRYVAEPDFQEEWWSDEESDKTNGDVDMSNGDSIDDDSDSQDNNSVEGNINSKVNTKLKHRLFTLHMVNSCGNVEIEVLHDDDKPIKFSNHTFIAINWNLKAKEKFFNKKSAEEVEKHESVSNRTKKQVMQLGECLDLFTTTEKLGTEDLWYCPSCKEHQQATKKFDLWSLPNVLVVHLKRFSYNRYWRDKIDTLIEFPTQGLNMAKFLIKEDHGPAVYDLIAVSNHFGGMGGGHYTAYAKNKEDGLWYYYDDTSVSSSNEENVVSKAAYVLFYQRRDASNLMNNNTQTIRHNAKLSAAAGSADQISSSPEDNDLMELN
ncbi:Ubiquitin carboxyl-terminal hydrolase 15 [Nymphon striatum]|nr:Ubiquitin carboxyl-terminal hydrolase 15 [Nymphon striatum]